MFIALAEETVIKDKTTVLHPHPWFVLIRPKSYKRIHEALKQKSSYLRNLLTSERTRQALTIRT